MWCIMRVYKMPSGKQYSITLKYLPLIYLCYSLVVWINCLQNVYKKETKKWAQIDLKTENIK